MPTRDCEVCGRPFLARTCRKTCSAECQQLRQQADPERSAWRRQKAREWYARHRERVQAKRRKRIAAMPDAEAAELAERARRYAREWARRNPHPEYDREYRRRRKAARLAGDTVRLEALLAGRDAGGKVKPCVVCGQPVVGRNPMAKVCSRECRAKRSAELARPPVTLTCVVCGREFVRRVASPCCSRECRRARRLGTTPDALPPPLPESVICDVCGAEFRPARHRQRGCSPECQKIGRLRRKLAAHRLGPYPPRPCVICSRDYVPGKKTQRTCSAACREEYHRQTEHARSAQKRRQDGDIA